MAGEVEDPGSRDGGVHVGDIGASGGEGRHGGLVPRDGDGGAGPSAGKPIKRPAVPLRARYSHCFGLDDSKGSDGSGTSPKYWPAEYSEREPLDSSAGRPTISTRTSTGSALGSKSDSNKWMRSCSMSVIDLRSKKASICCFASVAGRCCSPLLLLLLLLLHRYYYYYYFYRYF